MGRARVPGGRRMETKEEAAEPTQSTRAGRAARGYGSSVFTSFAELRENVQLRICRDGEELKHEGGEKGQGALRGLGDSAAEPKGPDAWLGPSSRPPISGHPLGQSLGVLLSPSFPRPPPSSPIGAISGAKRVQRSGRGPPW